MRKSETFFEATVYAGWHGPCWPAARQPALSLG